MSGSEDDFKHKPQVLCPVRPTDFGYLRNLPFYMLSVYFYGVQGWSKGNMIVFALGTD